MIMDAEREGILMGLLSVWERGEGMGMVEGRGRGVLKYTADG